MNEGMITIKYKMDENDALISRRLAVSRISDLICLELEGRCPTWNDVYNALNELPTVEPELPKKQEAIEVKYSSFHGVKYGDCPKCNRRIDNMVNPNFCGYCGQKVKWG